jgi:hypothetical protein
MQNENSPMTKVTDKLIYFGAGCGVGLVLGTLMQRLGRAGIPEKAKPLHRRVERRGNVAHFSRQRRPQPLRPERRGFDEPIDDADLSER